MEFDGTVNDDVLDNALDREFKFKFEVPESLVGMMEFAIIRAKWSGDSSLHKDDRKRYFGESLQSLKSVVLMMEDKISQRNY